ncbi:MAG: UdgX family uracil-DNA binding protein [Candidatus Rokuibacteriota bacterium]
MKRVEIRPTFEDWQSAARALLHARVPPDEVVWLEAGDLQGFLPGLARAAPAGAPGEDPGPTVRVPRLFVDLARRVAAQVDPDRWRLLYEALWRIVHESRDLLGDETDPLMKRLRGLEHQARGTAPSFSAQADEDSGGAALGAALFVPARATLVELRQAATRCQGCELYRHASQTVFGRGPADARVVLVGEQPGDQEDRQGAPFVGPAGEVFDRALVEVGLVREQLYVTNVVKHFKFVERGKRRIHQTPRLAEISACRPWLEAELAVVKPEVLVCLGATAARALLGGDFRIMKERGRWVESRWAPRTMATLHPSAVLRGEDDATQGRLYGMLLEDLGEVARAIG